MSSHSSSKNPLDGRFGGARPEPRETARVAADAWRSDRHLLGMEPNDTTQHLSLGLEPMIDISELSEYLGIPVSTIYDWRTRGLSPRAYHFGKHLKFAVSDAREWVRQQREPESPFQGR